MKENKKVEVKTVGVHRPGDVCELKVVRENEMGAFLDAGTGRDRKSTRLNSSHL